MSKNNMLGDSVLAEVAGPLKDFAEKLGGEQGSQWLAAFKRFLRKEEPWPKLPKFPVWKTIKLGTGPKTPDDFRRALKDGGFCIGNWANNILDKPTFVASVSRDLVEVDICIATTAELTGKSDGGTTREVFTGIKHLGGELCPAELGPQLRLQYPDQPNGEWILIAMEPIIADSDGDPHVFGVRRGGSELWLDGSWSDPDEVWFPDRQWIFVRPRK